MDAANASIQKYFVDDLSDLIDCMDFGFHQVRSLIIFFRFQISRQNLVSRAISHFRTYLKLEKSILPGLYKKYEKIKLFQSLYRAVMMHSSGLDQLRRSLQLDVEGLNKNLGSLDSRLDKQRFFEANNSSFMIPKKFEYNPVRRDETETLVHKSVLDELEVRKRKLQERLATLKGRF